MPKKTARKARTRAVARANTSALPFTPGQIKTGLLVLGIALVLTPLAIWGIVVLAGVLLHHFGSQAKSKRR